MTPDERKQPRRPEGQPQEAHRGRLRHQGRRGQQAPEDAPEHGRHDEGHGRRQGGARWPALRRCMGMGGGMPSPEEMAKLADKHAGRAPAAAETLPPGMPGSGPFPDCRAAGKFPGLGGLQAADKLPTPGGLPPDFFKKK